jgi:type IV pilus assembly protein PilC
MKYNFKAVKNNKVISGKMEANSQTDLIAYLKSKGYFTFEVRLVDESGSELIDNILNRVTFEDVVTLTRQLSITINAGLTLLDSLAIFKKQVEKKPLLKMIDNIDQQLRGGKTFSNALKKYSNHFSNMYIALVKSGEATGKLNTILFNLADNLEKKKAFVGKIKGAMVYPAVIFVGMIAIIFILLTFVVPQLTELYQDLDVELPLITQQLILVSDTLAFIWPVIIIAVIVAVVAFMHALKNKVFKLFIDNIIVKLPIMGKVYNISSLVNATRTLSILLSSGVSLLEGLDITVETTDNIIFQNSLKSVKKKVEQGAALGNAMEQEGSFPPMLIQMVNVGEQTGNLDETLEKVSGYFENESENAIKAMTTLIEPAILVVMGVIVGFIITAVITPIYSLTESFNQ